MIEECSLSTAQLLLGLGISTAQCQLFDNKILTWGLHSTLHSFSCNCPQVDPWIQIRLWFTKPAHLTLLLVEVLWHLWRLVCHIWVPLKGLCTFRYFSKYVSFFISVWEIIFSIYNHHFLNSFLINTVYTKFLLLTILLC